MTMSMQLVCYLSCLLYEFFTILDFNDSTTNHAPQVSNTLYTFVATWGLLFHVPMFPCSHVGASSSPVQYY
ncbi:hypothetical protein GGR54DRAFT_341567 [Hypoxylon sp. NC1633]|nr:hypothetical protein GGR54DRAFT_341567 [Hypoxylon sp. NC1633]